MVRPEPSAILKLVEFVGRRFARVPRGFAIFFK